MEARSSKSRKSFGDSLIKKPRKEIFLKRKALEQNLRSSARRKTDIPPLTPLHRLKRFKAIRDKNLKTKQLKNNMERTEVETTVQVHTQVTVTEEESEVLTESDVSPSMLKMRNSEKLENSSVEEREHNGNNELTNGGSGHLSSMNGNHSTNGHGVNSDDSEEFHEMNGVNEINVEDDFVESNVIESGSNSSETRESNQPQNKFEVSYEIMESETQTKEESIASSASTSTFQSNQQFTISSEDEEEEEAEVAGKAEVTQDKHEVNEGENHAKEDENDDKSEISEEKNEAKDNEEDSDSEKTDEKYEEAVFSNEPPQELKRLEVLSRIPRSVSSASSYKSAYGSIGKISGRRPVNPLFRTGSRKRKADEAVESSSGSRASSPSQASPRWRFFPSSVTNLWSPRQTPFVFSPSSTPVRNLEDSLAVNVDEDTINFHLNDTDLFSEASDTPPASKKSKWGCSVM